MRIALVGTRGVPAQYGGFETAVEEVGQRLAATGHDVTVYGRRTDGSAEFLGMKRVELRAVPRQSMETLSRTILAVLHVIFRSRPDVVIMFNCANSPLLPLLRLARIPTAVHTDGLEWRRGKWGKTGRRYYRVAEALGAGLADALISDADGIADYYRRRYGAESTVIAYGAAIVDPGAEKLQALDLPSGGYFLIVARLEAENNVDVILRGLIASETERKIVVVGSVPYRTDHLEEIERLADSDPRVRLLGGVWDQELLDALYGNACLYFHGHSVGGTNPSLLRAMGAGAAVASFDVSFNREVLGDDNFFWSNSADIATLVDSLDVTKVPAYGAANRKRVQQKYDWDDVATRYEKLSMDLHTGRRGRRTGTTFLRALGKIKNDPELDVR